MLRARHVVSRYLITCPRQLYVFVESTAVHIWQVVFRTTLTPGISLHYSERFHRELFPNVERTVPRPETSSLRERKTLPQTMPQDRLEQKLRQLGLSHCSHANARRLTFRVYFPRPPYGPVEYLAAKQGDGLNFVGQLLGHGGCTLKKIQTDSGARVEVHDGKGNLNGTHPSYTDPSIHAVVFAETREKLSRAAKMIAEVLQPVDAVFERFDVTPGASVVLKPVITRKAGSPQSEASSHSRGIWCGASSPTSEKDSCLTRDIDSAYIHPSHPINAQHDAVHRPWKRVSSLTSEKKETSFHVPPPPSENKPSEKENALGGLKEWKTWGSGNSDCYSQFTTLTQNFVSQYAHRPPTELPAIDRPSYFEPFRSSSVWNPVVCRTSAANQNGSSSCAQFHPSPSVEFPQRLGRWGKDKSMPETEALLLSNVYANLIGSTVSPATGAFPAVKESRLTSAYRITVEPEQTNSKITHQRIVLPHDL